MASRSPSSHLQVSSNGLSTVETEVLSNPDPAGRLTAITDSLTLQPTVQGSERRFHLGSTLEEASTLHFSRLFPDPPQPASSIDKAEIAIGWRHAGKTYLDSEIDKAICCRYIDHDTRKSVVAGPSDEITFPTGLVIGINKQKSTIPNERLIDIVKLAKEVDKYKPTRPFDPHEPHKSEPQLSDEMRRKINSIRGPSRFLSLKTHAGFGLYRCNVRDGTHTRVKLDPHTEKCMRQLFVSYSAGRVNYLIPWLQAALCPPPVGEAACCYSIEILLRWSLPKISAFILAPVVFSLAIGTYYMVAFGDAQTAWTIASYIVTTSGIIVALLALATAAAESE